MSCVQVSHFHRSAPGALARACTPISNRVSHVRRRLGSGMWTYWASTHASIESSKSGQHRPHPRRCLGRAGNIERCDKRHGPAWRQLHAQPYVLKNVTIGAKHGVMHRESVRAPTATYGQGGEGRGQRISNYSRGSLLPLPTPNEGERGYPRGWGEGWGLVSRLTVWRESVYADAHGAPLADQELGGAERDAREVHARLTWLGARASVEVSMECKSGEAFRE